MYALFTPVKSYRSRQNAMLTPSSDKQVFPSLEFIGWYTVGPKPTARHIALHEQVCRHAMHMPTRCTHFCWTSSLYIVRRHSSLSFSQVFHLQAVLISTLRVFHSKPMNRLSKSRSARRDQSISKCPTMSKPARQSVLLWIGLPRAVEAARAVRPLIFSRFMA
jgi:hypothetical protein